MTKTGFLLTNLGTPDAPKPFAVGRYLKQFLMDGYVIDIPKIWRWLLVHGIIVPFRSFSSAKLYANIWDERGSPLLYYSQDLSAKVQALLPDNPVVLGMRYGKPSLDRALRELLDAGCTEVVVLPLYPQYALASYGSTLAYCYELGQRQGVLERMRYLKPFFADDFYLDLLAKTIQEVLDAEPADFLLYSYHGVPEHQVSATGAGCEFKDACCQNYLNHNPQCYRAHCFVTTQKTNERLQLGKLPTGMAFQSRLGRRPWLRPYTDEFVKGLPAQGIKRLVVACPAFTADCLETLEEISIRLEEDFIAAGGEKVTLVPSLNARDDWSQALAEHLQSASSLPFETGIVGGELPARLGQG